MLTFDRELGQDEILASAQRPNGERLSGASMQELLEDPDVRAQLEARLPEGVTFDHLLT